MDQMAIVGSGAVRDAALTLIEIDGAGSPGACPTVPDLVAARKLAGPIAGRTRPTTCATT